MTVTGADVTVFPFASRPIALSVCEPLAAVTDTEYGALASSGPAFAPSTWNCTATIEADALALIENALDTVAPLPGALMEMVLGDWVAVKSTPVTFALLTETLRLAGANVKPLLVGVTRYVPLASPVKLNAPVASAVVFAVAAPPRLTAANAPSLAGTMAPDRE